MVNNILEFRADIARVLDALFTFSYKKDLMIHIYSRRNFPLLSIPANTLQTSLEQNTTWMHRAKQVNNTAKIPNTAEVVTFILLLNDYNINTVEYQYGTTETDNKVGFKILINVQYNNLQELLLTLSTEIKNYIKDKDFRLAPTTTTVVDTTDTTTTTDELGEMTCCCCCKYRNKKKTT